MHELDTDKAAGNERFKNGGEYKVCLCHVTCNARLYHHINTFIPLYDRVTLEIIT